MAKLIKNASDIRCKQLEERYGIPCNDIIKNHIKNTFEEAYNKKKELKNRSAQELADSFSWELFPFSWEKILNKSRIKTAMEETELIELKRENGEKCKGCGKMSLKMLHAKQIMNADEPDTTHWNCFHCGHNERRN